MNNLEISACICTYKRPDMLFRAINGVLSQKTQNLFSYEIIVVDNDIKQSAFEIVKQCQISSNTNITYDQEPEKNISLTRNRAVNNANSSIIVFLDDDEVPVKNWLLNLYLTYTKSNVDGVLGPVLPHFDVKPPTWLIRGRFCERKSIFTGKALHWDETRTGNVLLNKSIFYDSNCWFDEKYGRSGGEDVDFFKKAILAGRKFVWCNEAPVYETVPPDRWKESFYFKKNLRIGGLNGNRKRNEPGQIFQILKYIGTSIAYSLIFPISIFCGYHNFLKIAFKLTYNVSWFLGFCGIKISTNR